MTDRMTPWWQRAAIHRIWPRSFQDSDGIGDLRGVERRLGHLTALGADALVAPVHARGLRLLLDHVLRYDRIDPVDGRRLLVALNFGGAEQALDTRGRPLLSTHGDYGNPRRLRPHEGLVIEAD